MNHQNISVIKRNGSEEQLQLTKLHKMVKSACEGLSGVYPSQVEMNSSIQFYDKISTDEIQQILVKSAVNLISLDRPNYQYVAARLLLFNLRKEVWKTSIPPILKDFIESQISLGNYDTEILSYYSDEEWREITSFLDHDRDLLFAHAGLKQCMDKYLVQNRLTGEIFETPQFMYILISLILFKDYDTKTRLKYVKDYYDAISKFKISLPTPIMSGVRTPLRQFASCVLFDVDDNLNSIYSTNNAMGHYTAQRAGIGLNVGRIRAKGDNIRKGEVEHTGIIPFLKMFQETAHSAMQSGIRGGSVTTFFPIWHYDIQDLVVLKNNQGSDDNRVRHIDHCVQLSGIFYKRYMDNKNISLFSPKDVEGLYDSWGSENFDSIYLKAEKNKSIKRKSVNARELFHLILAERYETARLYVQNIDHTNSHSHSKSLIYMSNLCLEVTLNSIPINHIDDSDGRVATCILSALNVGKIKENEYEKICDLVVRGLDALIDYQTYPIISAELYTKKNRSLGVGVINYAYYLARNKVKWETHEAYKLTHELFEKIQYFLLKSSNELAKEFGACEDFYTSKYSDGILPIDTYKKSLDEIHNSSLLCDWELLRTNISKYGLRNVCLSAIAPTESSSVISGSTSGIDPARDALSIKRSKKGDLKMIVPGYEKYRSHYEFLWDMKDMKGYLNNCAIMQKFIDQSISTNTSYNPKNYDVRVPLQELVSDLFHSYAIGIKTLYYNNPFDENENDKVDDDSCLACKI
jgi:ribonucleoside-diphosphate reductase alpha chain